MASWKKHFQVVPTKKLRSSGQSFDGGSNGSASSTGKYASWLPEVYSGQPNRIERYSQYDQMDLDSEVNAALDTIADFCTQIDDNEDLPLRIIYNEEPTESETEILELSIRQWCKLNDFRKKIWRTFRNIIKYGDQFFVRDPETYEWMWVDQTKVQTVIVNEAEGKTPEQYWIKDIDLNIIARTATSPRKNNLPTYNQSYGTTSIMGGIDPVTAGGALTSTANNMQGRFGANGESVTAVDAQHVIHLSLSEGMDASWPFGSSILESVFKIYKQKELLEDSIIIYRIQRAPERRIFYIDVGNMPTHKAMAYIERVKNDIHQRRIPNRTGGGQSVNDAAYNSLSILDDYFFAQNADGRGSKVETLPGGDNLGQIADMLYFSNKLFRGLRIPSSYLPMGPDDGQAQYSDGRVGTAYIQEWRFSKYCQRLQSIVSPVFDAEFKLFLKKRGVEIPPSLFEVAFQEPQNFGDFKRMEVDSQRLGLYQQVKDIPHISKRFALIKYLGWTEDEMMENEKLWAAENASRVNGKDAGGENDGELRDVGISGGGGGFGGDFGGDFGGEGDLGGEEGDLGGGEGGDLGGESPISGGEPGGSPTGGPAQI